MLGVRSADIQIEMVCRVGEHTVRAGAVGPSSGDRLQLCAVLYILQHSGIAFPIGGERIMVEALGERHAGSGLNRYGFAVVGDVASAAIGCHLDVILRKGLQAGESIRFGSYIHRIPFGIGNFLVLQFPCRLAGVLRPVELDRALRRSSVYLMQLGRFETGRKRFYFDVIKGSGSTIFAYSQYKDTARTTFYR